jgi:hypothetical protein
MCAIRPDWLLLAPGIQGLAVPESFAVRARFDFSHTMAPLVEDQTTRTFCGLDLENEGYLVSPPPPDLSTSLKSTPWP